jgi:hypothetical protein
MVELMTPTVFGRARCGSPPARYTGCPPARCRRATPAARRAGHLARHPERGRRILLVRNLSIMHVTTDLVEVHVSRVLPCALLQKFYPHRVAARGFAPPKVPAATRLAPQRARAQLAIHDEPNRVTRSGGVPATAHTPSKARRSTSSSARLLALFSWFLE